MILVWVNAKMRCSAETAKRLVAHPLIGRQSSTAYNPTTRIVEFSYEVHVGYGEGDGQPLISVVARHVEIVQAAIADAHLSPDPDGDPEATDVFEFSAAGEQLVKVEGNWHRAGGPVL